MAAKMTKKVKNDRILNTPPEVFALVKRVYKTRRFLHSSIPLVYKAQNQTNPTKSDQKTFVFTR